MSEKLAASPADTQRTPGFVDKATISKGWTMHIPGAVARYWSLEEGDVLEFYNPLTDLPDDLAMRFELMAVVVKRKHPIDDEEFKAATKEATRRGMPPLPDQKRPR